MSTKRKAEGHWRATSKPQSTMKAADRRADSERDSGFSDASSEHLSAMDTTDSEDSPRPSQLAVVGGSYSNLSPMIIMNNVLLKQPGDSPPALKPWGFGSTVEVVQQPQVVFLQPVVSRQASSTSKGTSSRHRWPKKYLPILKSYPKIAPHPGDGSSSSGRGTASSSSSGCSSSSSSGSDRGRGLVSSHRDHSQRDKRQKKVSGGSGSSALLPPPPSSTSPLLQRHLSVPSAETSARSSPARSSPARERPTSVISQPDLTCSMYFTPSDNSNCSENDTLLAPQAAVQEVGIPGKHDHADGNEDTRRKRFCNTYNILSQSGLLDITLRTKELLRQNRRTQSDLERLKQHTELFLLALKSGDSGICIQLQASLQEDERERDAPSGCKAD